LTLSSDRVLLSGHRRLAAARYLGLQHVPVRLTDLIFEDLSKDERLQHLRRFNQQRDKSPGERIRERLLEIDPAHAYSKLLCMRVNRHLPSRGIRSQVNVDLGQTKRRARITTMGFLHAVQNVVEANREYWPMTDRRVHYLLLNDPPLRHDRKPNSRYLNDHASYKALTNLLVRARLTGDVPIEAIEDSTRPVQEGGGFDSLVS
jgi:hypothetical protein